MITIALNNYINIDPKYYLNRYIFPCQQMSLTFEEFKEILSFCARGNSEPIYIVGGEPTIHPDFDKMLKEINIYCRENNTYAILRTNGTKMDSFLPLISDKITIICPYITVDEQNLDFYEEQEAFLKRAYELSWLNNKCIVEFPIYIERDDFDHIAEVIDKYQLTKFLVTIPMPSDEYVQSKKDYYTAAKVNFIKICQLAQKKNCKIVMQNGYNIPLCYLTEDEKYLAQQVLEQNITELDLPKTEYVIYPNLAASIPTKHSESIDYRNFDTPEDLKLYLNFNIFFPALKDNRTEKCSSCQLAQLYKCQCGNLKFANV